MRSARRLPSTQVGTRLGPKCGTGLRAGSRYTVETERLSGSFSKKPLRLRETVDRNTRPSRADPKMQSILRANSTRSCRSTIHNDQPNSVNGLSSKRDRDYE